MADRSKKILHLVRDVCEEENLRLTLSGSFRSGVYTIVGGFAGSLTGPWGVIPGAVAGAAIAKSTGEDFKPLWNAIVELPVEAQQRLADNIEKILRQLGVTEITTLAAMAVGAAANLQSEISAAVIAFCQNEIRK